MQDPKQRHAVARQQCGVARTEPRARVKLGHGSRREAGREHALGGGEFSAPVRHLRAGGSAKVADQGANELETDDEQKKKDAKNRARVPLRQPALDPGKDGTGENEIDEGEGQQDERGPNRQRRIGERYAAPDPQQPKTAQSRGDIEGAISYDDEEIRPITEREPQKDGGIRTLREGSRHHGKKLPEHKYGPQ